MDVVWVGGPFVSDHRHFEVLASELRSFTVYGSTARSEELGHRPTAPSVPHRDLTPRGPRGRTHLWWAYPRLAAALDEDSPDLVHVVSEPWGLMAQQVVHWGRRHPDVAIVVHGCDRIWWHGSRPEQVCRRWVVNRTIPAIDGFLAETAVAVDRAREVGLAHDAVTGAVHTNPRDPAVFAPGAGGQVEARRRLGLPERGVGLGYLGRFAPEKGVEVLLGAIERLPPAAIDGGHWFAVAGSGPLEHAVRAGCERLGIHQLGPLWFPHGVADLYAALDVVVVPSYVTPSSDEQSPRVVIEAMLAGCDVVASDCGAIPEMLGGSGVIVGQRDEASLADGILAAIGRVDGAPQAEVRRRKAMDRYSSDSVALQLLEAWRLAAGRRRGGRPIAEHPTVPGRP